MTKSQQVGFSLIELSLVLVLVTLLVSLGLPLLKNQIQQSKYTQDRDNLANLAKNIIGYAALYGGLPPYPTSNGSSLLYNLPSNLLTADEKNAYSKALTYDADSAIQFTSLTDPNIGRSLVSFCGLLTTAMSAAATTKPAVCAQAMCDTSNAANYSGVAFVLTSSGPNYKFDTPNADSDRIYASQFKGFDMNYEDLVKSVSHAELYEALSCDTRTTTSGTGGGNWGGTGLDCSSGLAMSVKNGGTQPLYLTISGTECYAVLAKQEVNYCPNGSSSISNVRIYENGDCRGTNVFYHVNDLADTNNDNIATLTCTGSIDTCSLH